MSKTWIMSAAFGDVRPGSSCAYRSKRTSLGVCLVAGPLILLATVTAGAEEDPCPSPRTCDYYVLNYSRWPTPLYGPVRIPYYVNPVQPYVPLEDALAAIRTAFETWEAAVPSVRFDFMGTTARVAVPGDGQNVVSWGASVGAADTTWLANLDGLYSMDTTFSLPYPQWVAIGCEQRDGSCGQEHVNWPNHWYLMPPGDNVPEYRVWNPRDIQDVMTHEVGHWLGLGDLYQPQHSELTMNTYGMAGAANTVDFRKATLGLGDILGARAQYPCDCPAPVIFEP